MTEDVVFQSDSAVQRAAQNAWLQVGARILMILAGGLGFPAIIIIGTNISDILSGLRSSINEMKLSISQTKSEVLGLKTLQEYQLRVFEDRISAQSRRMDTQDTRIERLERPFFDGRRGGPASP